MEKNLDFLFSALEEMAPKSKPERGVSNDRPLRTSSYTIYVDLPNDEEMLLVHGYLGSYDLVSRSVAAYLRSMEPKRAPKPLFGVWNDKAICTDTVAAPDAETLVILKKRGYLTRRTVAEEEAFFKAFVAKMHANDLRQPPSYVLMPTYSCNLRCHYCFQDHMRTNPAFSHLLKTISRDMVDRIFNGIPQIEAMHDLPKDASFTRSYTLFGGEPLLAGSRAIVEYILKKISDLGPFKILTISNATELDAYADLLGPDCLSAIQVTLDGPSTEHDKRRIYPDGGGSFAKIARNIDLALAKEVNVNVRLNLDRNNIHDLPDLVGEVMKQGWHREKNFSMYAAPIRSDEKRPEIMDSWELVKTMMKLQKEHPDLRIVGKPDDNLRNRAVQMFAEPGKKAFPAKQIFCGAHNWMYIFDAFGDIYACWERTGDTKIRLGNITADGEVHLNRKPNLEWRTRTVASNPVCGKCRYALHCGGGCAVLAEGRTGKMHANFCDGYASRFRAVLADTYLSSNLATQSIES